MSTRSEYNHGEFCWVDLVAHDMAAARSFYEQLFGWSSRDMDTKGGPPYAQFEKDGQAVAGIGQMSEEMKQQGIPPTWNSYINVEDVQAAAAKSGQLGGTVTVPPMPVVDAGWLAFVRDPTGGHVAFWQKSRHIGAELVSGPGSFCWNELVTRDVEKARQFYGELLGWEYVENPDAPSKYYIARSAGRENGGIMHMSEQWGEVPSHWSVYFAVEDADAFAERITSLGGKVLVPPFETPAGRVTVVGDNQGAIFNAIAMTAPLE